MKDAFHGSARLPDGPQAANRDVTITRPYHGSTVSRRRRGTAHTAPIWIRRAGGHCLDRLPRILLGIDVSWGAIPCWSGRSQRWIQSTVPVAYHLRYDTDVRPAMPGNPVSLTSLTAVAAARASFADHRTGRNCRPTNGRLAEMTGLSTRTVQRASTALRLLGVATEVLRGRQRTRAERFASWRVGDRGRGWASVWALHDSRVRSLSPHPEGSYLAPKTSRKSVLTTETRPKAGRSGAPRRTAHDAKTLLLAARWVQDPHSPPWATRYRTGTPWARVLQKAAAHEWTPRDINQLINDWIGTGHWVPENPHKPIGLLATILATHANMAERPAALDEAREHAELAAARARIAQQAAEHQAHRQAREAGRAALGGAGHTAARNALNDILRRRRTRRDGDGEQR